LPAGQLTITPNSTLTIMENRPRTFCLSLRGNLSLYATAPTAEDLSGWLSALRTAINVEKKIREADLLSDSCSDSQEEQGGEEEKEEKEEKDEELAPKARGGWAILEPMKGLFNQLLDQYVAPSSEQRAIDSATSSILSAPSGRMFGHPLNPSINIPNIVRQCCEFLLEDEHVKTEGILRVSGQSTTVQTLKQIFDDKVENKQNLRNVLIETASNRKFDVFNVGTLLKSYLSAMPESVRSCFLLSLHLFIFSLKPTYIHTYTHTHTGNTARMLSSSSSSSTNALYKT